MGTLWWYSHASKVWIQTGRALIELLDCSSAYCRNILEFIFVVDFHWKYFSQFCCTILQYFPSVFVPTKCTTFRPLKSINNNALTESFQSSAVASATQNHPNNVWTLCPMTIVALSMLLGLYRQNPFSLNCT